MKNEDAVPYLVDCGLVSPRDILRWPVRVEDNSRRNRNLRVLFEGGPCFFLKRADHSDPSSREGIRREAAHYERSGKFASPGVKRLLPRFYSYDPARDILVLEFIPSALPLSQFLDARPFGPHAAAAGATGRALAACFLSRVAGQHSANTLPDHLPWALQFAFPSPQTLRTMSIGQMEVVRAIQRDDLACRALGALGANYRGTALVHGDFRWDNILVQGTTRSRISRLHLIDWELAGSGDAAWDVGTSFASFLGRCLRFMDPGENVTSSTLRSAFIRRLPSSQIEMGAFWREFARTAHLDSALRRAVLVRATNYCGAKLLQTAYEWSPANTVSPIAACYLQLGLNMLRSPQEATLRVLGIDPRAN